MEIQKYLFNIGYPIINFWTSLIWFMDIQNYIVISPNRLLDIQKWIMDIQKWIMDIKKIGNEQ